MAYLLDANVFLQAKNTHYGFDFCPAFWDWIDLKRSTGVVLSVNEVKDELIGRDDEIADWARARGEDFFMKPDTLVAPSLAVVSDWVQSNPDYYGYAKFEFFGSADFALVTYAHAHKLTVVTHERPEASKKKVKIPSVCLGVGVDYTNTYTMLRREKARFVLDVVT